MVYPSWLGPKTSRKLKNKKSNYPGPLDTKTQTTRTFFQTTLARWAPRNKKKTLFKYSGPLGPTKNKKEYVHFTLAQVASQTSSNSTVQYDIL